LYLLYGLCSQLLLKNKNVSGRVGPSFLTNVRLIRVFIQFSKANKSVDFNFTFTLRTGTDLFLETHFVIVDTRRDHLEDPGVEGRIILKWFFERLGGGHRLD
jgi:hypothetical protein